MDILSLSIESAYKKEALKIPPLVLLRIKVGLLQNLIRTENELKILDDETYLRFSAQIVEISKMASGWINYMNAKPA
ncbi:MAG: hypothetical protein WC631_02705 [Candidatus Paceibacterota bacterium]|jgi:hypothetical protein